MRSAQNKPNSVNVYTEKTVADAPGGKYSLESVTEAVSVLVKVLSLVKVDVNV